MTTFHRKGISGLMLALTSVCAPSALGQAAFWRVRELGPVHADSFAYGINDAGWVAGAVYTPQGARRATLWDPDGTLIDLGGLGDDYAELGGINQAGTAAGFVYGNDGNSRAVTWSAAGGVVELSGLSSGGDSRAFSISDDGTVVGDATAPSEPGHAVIWESGAIAPTDLGFFAGASDSVAWDCNSSGQVCGAAYGSDFVTIAFVGSAASGIQALTYVPGRATEALGINEAGAVAGTVEGPTGGARAAVWRLGTGWHPIELEATAAGSYGYDINNSGWVVGEQIITGPNIGRATVWDPFETATELPTSSPGSSRVYRINENLHVVGWAQGDDGFTHATVWYRTTHGDTDEDCDVDLNDLARVLSSFSCCTGEPCFLAEADVSPNGCVDLNDLTFLLARFGNVCP